MLFQSTLPARGATEGRKKKGVTQDISIHAPRTGSDGTAFHQRQHAGDFNPRSPHGERPSSMAHRAILLLFQSTLPARGATTSPISSGKSTTYFNPRSPHGERRSACIWMARHTAFQSTLPARGATRRKARCCTSTSFQSTLPARGATSLPATRTSSESSFQSTLPARGATNVRMDIPIHKLSFQSTLPARGATQRGQPRGQFDFISIHAPRTGSDDFANIERKIDNVFQSTLPARGATRCRWLTASLRRFQSTLPARGATRCNSGKHGESGLISIHAPRTGSDATTS